MKSNLCGFLRLHFDAAKQQGTKIAWSFSQMHVYVISWLPLRCSLFRVSPKLTQQHLKILRQNRVGFLLYWQYLGMIYGPNLIKFSIKKEIGYIRASSLEQNPERQLAGTTLDKASGKDTQRPELDTLLDYVRDGYQVFVYSMDRLARSLDNLRSIVLHLNPQ